MRYHFLPWLFLFFLPTPLHPYTQSQVFSPEAILVIATHEKIYSFFDDNATVFLGKEASYLNFNNSQNGTRYKYTITSVFPHGETIDETCLQLPEIGEWSVIGYEYKEKMQSRWDSYIKLYFYLQCNPYDGSDIIRFTYPMGYGLHDLIFNEHVFEMHNWYSFHFGERSSLENLSHIRLKKETLYKNKYNNKKYEIFVVSDMISKLDNRIVDHYDDLFFYHNDDTNHLQPAFLTCFIVPRIFLMKFEEPSLSIDITDDLSPIRFTIIVQQFENQEKTVWNYHRLEIVREQSAHEIQINDLGPVPRSEWEPGWPDPAVTPLWKKPESECAQCQ